MNVHGCAYTDANTADTRYFHTGCAEAWGLVPPGFRFQTFAKAAAEDGRAFIGRRGTLEPIVELPQYPYYPLECANCAYPIDDAENRPLIAL